MKQKHSQGLRDVYCYHEIKESEDIPKEKKKALSKSLSIYLTQHHVALFSEQLVLQYPYTLPYLVMLNFTGLLIKAKL